MLVIGSTEMGWKVGSFSPPGLLFPQHGQLLTLPIPNCLSPPHSPRPRSKPFLTPPSPAITVCLESASYLVPVCLTPASLSLLSPLLQPSHPPGSSERYKVRGAWGQTARKLGPWSSELGSAPGGTYLPSLKPSGAGWGGGQAVTESHILGQEVMLGREAHNGLEASTVVWGLTHGSSHCGAKRTKPQTPTQQGVLRWQKEVESVLPLMIEGRAVFPRSPTSPHPTNCYYFLLLAVSSNKLRLITCSPA